MILFVLKILLNQHSVCSFSSRNPEDLVVRLGEWDFSSTSETIEYQEIPLERIECHPQFSYKHLKYDVALLFLATEAVLGSTVDTICLPEHEHDFDGSTCVSSGWGKSSFGEGGKYQEVCYIVFNYLPLFIILKVCRLR